MKQRHDGKTATAGPARVAAGPRRPGGRRRVLGVAALALAAFGARSATPATDEPVPAFAQKAMTSRLAAASVMLDLARAGERLVAVGERGRVLLSDDAGRSWRQSASVPVSVTLTAVAFADPRHGWAVGHAGVVLHTADGGETWRLQLDGVRAARLALASLGARPADDPAMRTARQWVADGPDKPFLALDFSSALRGTVVGAYGLAFSTVDGGATWVSRLADIDNPGGLHLNAIRTLAGTTYLAGEKGLLLRSQDGGRFDALESPYAGSWFAIDALPGGPAGSLVVAGLRGHVYASDDRGTSWRRVAVPTGATFSQLTRAAATLLLFVDQGGGVFALDDRRRFVPLALPPGAPVTSIAIAGDGAIVAATLRGPVRLPIDVASVAKPAASR